MKQIVVYAGQKVIDTSGQVVTVAYEDCGQVYAFGRKPYPEPVKVCGDAFGGEHDQLIGLAA